MEVDVDADAHTGHHHDNRRWQVDFRSQCKSCEIGSGSAGMLRSAHLIHAPIRYLALDLPKRLRRILWLWVAVTALSSCALSIAETPQSLGTSAGEEFAQLWNDRYASGAIPASEALATYCVDYIQAAYPRANWSQAKQLEFSDACVEAAIKGLK
mgnify:CR=1 FL=1